MKEIFEHIIQTPNIKYKHAKGMRDIFGKEFHQFHEIFLFISGNAFFITEEKTVKLKPSTLIIIPQNTFHGFHVEGCEDDYERYVFNFYDTKEIDKLTSKNMPCVRIIENLSESIIKEFTSLDDNKYSDFEKELLTPARLMSVLVELGHLLPSEENITSKFSIITAKCLNYINHLCW